MYNYLLSLVQEGTFFSAIISFVLMIFISFIPAMPIPVIAGAIGTAFGFWPALFISWIGSTFGSVLMLLFARFLFQKHALKYINLYKRLAVIRKFLEKNAFLAILIVRLIPIFPSVIVNLVTAVSNIPIRTFLIATLLGKLPSMITFTLAGNHLVDRTWIALTIVGLYSIVIFILVRKVNRKIES